MIIVNSQYFVFSVKKNNLDSSDSPKTPISDKTPVKRKSLVMSNKKLKKIKNV